MLLNVAQIRLGLAKLRKLDPAKEMFGAGIHYYSLYKPLSDADIDSFEKRYETVLPKEYREFLTRCGNGGAGPAYGLFSLEQHDEGHGYTNFQSERSYICDLSKDFPHSDKWNLPESFWEQVPSEDDIDTTYGGDGEAFEDDVDAWYERVGREYYDHQMDGALPICHLGCATRDWLVIQGPLSGTIWRDDRPNTKGIWPLKNRDGTRQTFSQWYTAWMDEYIDKLSA